MRRACLMALAVVLLGATHLSAFILLRVDSENPCGNSQHLFWPDAVAFVDAGHLQPPVFATYARQARDRWNQAVSTFRFQDGSGDFCNPGDGVTSMGFSDTACDGKGFGDAISITFFRFNRNSGVLLDADVSFDAGDPDLGDQALFRQIAMHELGHVLGLGHSDACGASGAGTLMKSVAFLNEPRLERPQGDDIAGAEAIYGRSSGDGSVPEGANSCSIVPNHTKRGFAIEMFVLPILLLIARGAETIRVTWKWSPSPQPVAWADCVIIAASRYRLRR